MQILVQVQKVEMHVTHLSWLLNFEEKHLMHYEQRVTWSLSSTVSTVTMAQSRLSSEEEEGMST